MSDSNPTSLRQQQQQQAAAIELKHQRRLSEIVDNTMHTIVLILSMLLIVYISFDTFKRIKFLDDANYMTFQLWVCVIFMLDFFIEWYFSVNKKAYFWHRLPFFLLSIPYLNIIAALDIHLSHDALYFVRFIPLARGALALSIVMSYISKNAITSFFMSYLTIMIMTVYFCSLIFFQREMGVNPQVDTYWTALWWSAMNMSTVGCNISPVTVSGKIVAVVLPVSGMIIFPLFTVYLTDYVTRSVKRAKKREFMD